MDPQRIRIGVRHARRFPEVVSCIASVYGGTRVAAGYAGLTSLRFPVEIRFRSGLTYRLHEYYDLETLWQINFHQVYHLHPTDSVIVDAGANVGFFTCWAAASNPRAHVIAVEPSQGNYTRLIEHVKRNALESRVTTFRLALSSAAGTVWLSERSSASQMHHVTEDNRSGATGVQAISLQDLLARLPYDRIDFLKMDIEGSEYPVLMSATADCLAPVRRLTVEYHATSAPNTCNKEALIEHLQACGFRSVTDRSPQSAYGLIDAVRE